MLTVSLKCFTLFFIVLSMYPKQTHQSIGTQKQPAHYKVLRRPSNVNIPSSIFRGLSGRQTQDDNNGQDNPVDIPDQDDEPGFDLTDEEIRKFKLWDRGVIPYYIDGPSFTDKVLRNSIRWFLNMVNTMTTLNFVELPHPPRDEKERWVFFINRRGQLNCADHSTLNLTNEGVQRVVLGYDCMITGGELAEAVLSIVGVPSQHNAPNRDDLISVIDENIQPEKKYLFQKLKNNEWLFHDLEYDFGSAGHYHYHKFSVNGRATIKPHQPTHSLTVDKRGLSARDYLKIKMLYNYIVKSKKNNSKVSLCNKLFMRGKGNQVKPHTNRKIEPRPKPVLYVGAEGNNDGGNNVDEDENSETRNRTSSDHRFEPKMAGWPYDFGLG